MIYQAKRTSRSRMASNSAQNLINFNEIATAYNSLSNASGNVPRGLQVNDSKLTQVTLKARDVTWNPSEMTPVSRRDTKSIKYSHTTQETMHENASIQIHLGLCTGLNTKVYLPYPGVEDGSRVLLVDPCSPKQSQTFSTPVLLTSQGRGQRGHTVEEAMERQEYNGSFECKVYPGGFILTEAEQGGKATRVVIEALNEKKPYTVQGFERDDEGRYYFKMQGSCILEVDTQLQHNWNKARDCRD
ncbi:hypothetical protein RRG08_061414 [Elysia crispata]|uniref:Uncharacterized protein n=1 Tax=Elysia crispata TaxID=231223 RepID=A0AAE0Y7J0_9GAST|nr:hypothetical protein RRG08_061414 [Elysia crispata]